MIGAQEERAKANLPVDARELVELARCPKCRKRGARGIRSLWLVQMVQVAFILAIFVGLPALLFRFMFAMPITTSELALLLLVMPYLAIRFFVRLWEVDRRVVFSA